MDKETSDKSKIVNLFKDKKEPQRAEFIAAFILNIILFYIINNLLNWNLSFIDKTFADVLGVLNLLLISSIIINFLFIFYHPSWFRNLLSTMVDILGFITAYTLYTVFPFIISNILMEYFLRFIIIICIIGCFISLIVHLLKFLFAMIDG